MFCNITLVRYKKGEEIPTRGVVKHPFKVHVWGAFCSQGIVGFHMFTQNMDGKLYHEILTNNLFDQAYHLLGESWTFMILSTRQGLRSLFLRINVLRFSIGHHIPQI